jgi:hypothetical protein
MDLGIKTLVEMHHMEIIRMVMIIIMEAKIHMVIEEVQI